MTQPTTIVLASNLRDGRQFIADHLIGHDQYVIVTPHNPFMARGWQADRIAVTEAARAHPDLDAMRIEALPCLSASS